MELGQRYLIALPVDDRFLEEYHLESLKDKVDLFEFRVDQFKNKDVEYIKKLAQKVKSLGLGIILTIRSKEEGGADIPDNIRIDMFKKLIPFADIVDIELNSKINKEIITTTKNYKKLALVSYHDFEKTPEENEIQKIIDKGKELKANIIKYAFKVNKEKDVGKILSVTYKNADVFLVAIGMGDLGKITRIAGFFFGSIMTYTYVGQSFAPGQIELHKLIEELRFLNLHTKSLRNSKNNKENTYNP
ncbi:MAG: type I 3-dehydroquinate dehydratase [Aquificae bacterium]|nr:type I 3-dehydroquinate dehydratase [Aquificota bacterium]